MLGVCLFLYAEYFFSIPEQKGGCAPGLHAGRAGGSARSITMSLHSSCELHQNEQRWQADLGCGNCNSVLPCPWSSRITHSSQQKAKESCSALAAAMGCSLAPTPPSQPREDTHVPRCHLHSCRGLLLLSFKGSPHGESWAQRLLRLCFKPLRRCRVCQVSLPAWHRHTQEQTKCLGKESQLGQDSEDIRNV